MTKLIKTKKRTIRLDHIVGNWRQSTKHIRLAGDHYEMGQQHGRQVSTLRPYILVAMSERLAKLTEVQIDARPIITEISSIWDEIARPTMDMLRGIADALALEWEPFFRYTITPDILDRLRYQHSESQGCTTWAASGPITRHGVPILAKNRDYRPNHQELQHLVNAHPNNGYHYVYLTSAGSPGVFSSGMNEAGLVAADTHVSSLDVGPGLPRYAIMMEILEHHNSVTSALEYLQENQHTGNGTITLLDASGDMVVFETGHTNSGTICSEEGFVVSTNHFVSPQLCNLWRERNPQKFRGNSSGRYGRVRQALLTTQGKVDISWAKALMTSHGDSKSSICRHKGVNSFDSTTISSILFLPHEKQLFLANGTPCITDFQTLSLN